MENSRPDNSHIYDMKKERLVVKDNKKFLELLTGTDPDSHAKLSTYAKKIICSKAADIPHGEHKAISNMAILKALQSYNEEAGSNFLTYLTNKIRGEISDYRNKKDSMLRKVHKMVNYENTVDNGESFAYVYDKDSESNTLDKITEETPETILFADDIYYRKIQAFRMAYSGIPAYSQFILTRLIDSDLKLKDVAEQEKMTTAEITRMRNYSLSLILNRVLRSNHLTSEEKEEMKIEHGIV